MDIEAQSNSKIKYLIILILLILIIIGGFYIFKSSKNTNVEPTPQYPTPSNPTVTVSTPEDMLKVMRSTGKIELPEISSEKISAISQLPIQFKDFILAGAYDTRLKSVVYKDGKSGFVIEYTVINNVKANFDIFRSLAISYGELVYSTHSNLAALVNFAQGDGRFLVELSKYGSDEAKVRIYIQ